MEYVSFLRYPDYFLFMILYPTGLTPVGYVYSFAIQAFLRTPCVARMPRMRHTAFLRHACNGIRMADEGLISMRRLAQKLYNGY